MPGKRRTRDPDKLRFPGPPSWGGGGAGVGELSIG